MGRVTGNLEEIKLGSGQGKLLRTHRSGKYEEGCEKMIWVSNDQHGPSQKENLDKDRPFLKS